MLTRRSMLAAAAVAVPTGGAVAAARPWVPVKSIDFSARHDQLIQNMDGTFSRMDEVYLQSRPIAPGTWQLLSDGDYMYLVEGDREALLIDSGYGAGNIREYAQSLTRKPLRYVAITHAHFDHTANAGYFDRAYMSQGTKDALPAPSATFTGVAFPKDYPIQVIGDGFKFQLGNREIETFLVGNHTPGGTAYLDRKQRILFSGDEIMGQQGFPLRVSVERFAQMMEKLAAHRRDYDTLCAGWQILEADWIDKYLALARHVLAGNQGVPLAEAPPSPRPQGWRDNANAPKDAQGRPIYLRHIPRGGGGGAAPGATPDPNILRISYGGATFTYDRRRVRE